MKPYEVNLTLEECKKFLEEFRARNVQPYQPLHMFFPDFCTPHKAEGYKRRTKAINNAIGDPTGMHILDLGSAVGWNLFEQIFRGATGVGVEISKGDVHISSCLAKVYGVESKVRFYPMNVVEFIYETEEHFDVALVLNLLNHIINQIGKTDGWNWMYEISNKSDAIITNYYEGVKQDRENLLANTRFNRCDVIKEANPYYNNMGRKLFKVY